MTSSRRYCATRPTAWDPTSPLEWLRTSQRTGSAEARSDRPGLAGPDESALDAAGSVDEWLANAGRADDWLTGRAGLPGSRRREHGGGLMRLHSLDLQAFGPFATPQRVDFDRLAGGGLFLLEGPTGAGKTTVLDAITFALYGGLAGEDAAEDRLHSHFASPESSHR